MKLEVQPVDFQRNDRFEFLSSLHRLRGGFSLTIRCSESGLSVAVAIIAPREPGR
jgi:hypothetical protein